MIFQTPLADEKRLAFERNAPKGKGNYVDTEAFHGKVDLRDQMRSRSPYSRVSANVTQGHMGGAAHPLDQPVSCLPFEIIFILCIIQFYVIDIIFGIFCLLLSISSLIVLKLLNI